jgi:hypothetical protein
MIKLCCSLLLTVSLTVTIFAQQPPGTEIYFLDLTIKKEKVVLANPQNITNHTGYDNQPSFHPDKPLMFYSSANAEGKTDIIEYNMSTKATRHITTTSEREYSPTVTPDKNFLSCIIQHDNGAQDLGKYPIEGGEPVILINTLKVGYHAWINPDNLLLFVLGDTLTLRTYDLVSNKDVILVKNIGRSLHKIPNTSEMSFVHKVSTEEWLIKKINADGTIETLTPTLPGREDLTWTPDGKILMSDGKRFFYYQPGKTSSWQEIEMPISIPSGAITRLAVNSKGNTLAIVVTE